MNYGHLLSFESTLAKRENLKGAFRIKEDIKQKRILLVDDIIESAATIREIASVLKSARASRVVPLVIAKSTGTQSVGGLGKMQPKSNK